MTTPRNQQSKSRLSQPTSRSSLYDDFLYTFLIVLIHYCRYKSRTPGKENGNGNIMRSKVCLIKCYYKTSNPEQDTPSMKRATIKSGAIRMPAKRMRKDVPHPAPDVQASRPALASAPHRNNQSNPPPVLDNSESFIKKTVVTAKIVRERPSSPFTSASQEDNNTTVIQPRSNQQRHSLFQPPVRQPNSRSTINSRDLPRVVAPSEGICLPQPFESKLTN